MFIMWLCLVEAMLWLSCGGGDVFETNKMWINCDVELKVRLMK